MNDLSNLSHTAWDCKYHIVWIPKYRKKVLYGQLRKHLGQVLRELAIRKESLVVEGHLMADHVHMLIVIPPKYAVSQVVGFIKGKSAIHSPGHTRQEAELHRAAFLGQRILCVHGGEG